MPTARRSTVKRRSTVRIGALLAVLAVGAGVTVSAVSAQSSMVTVPDECKINMKDGDFTTNSPDCTFELSLPSGHRIDGYSFSFVLGQPDSLSKIVWIDPFSGEIAPANATLVTPPPNGVFTNRTDLIQISGNTVRLPQPLDGDSNGLCRRVKTANGKEYYAGFDSDGDGVTDAFACWRQKVTVEVVDGQSSRETVLLGTWRDSENGLPGYHPPGGASTDPEPTTTAAPAPQPPPPPPTTTTTAAPSTTTTTAAPPTTTTTEAPPLITTDSAGAIDELKVFDSWLEWIDFWPLEDLCPPEDHYYDYGWGLELYEAC